MRYLKLAKKNKDADPKAWTDFYESLIVKKIRARYTVNQELAILRQQTTKPEEFAAYNEYAEQCKAEAKAELEI